MDLIYFYSMFIKAVVVTSNVLIAEAGYKQNSQLCLSCHVFLFQSHKSDSDMDKKYNNCKCSRTHLEGKTKPNLRPQ